MTAATLRPATSRIQVTQARVLRSEWTKFRSLRSTGTTLLVAVALLVGLGAALSAVTAAQYDTFSAGDRSNFDAIDTSLGGITFAQLAIGVLGVLLITGEYSTGMIHSSLTIVPRRLPVLWAKLAVFAAVAFAVSLAASLASFAAGQALLSSKGIGVSLTSPGALGSVVGAAVYLTLAGLIALGVGALLRNTAAAISLFVAVFFVIPPLTQLLPATWTSHFVQYLPSNAGSSLFLSDQSIDNPLSAATGLAVLAGYAVALVAFAAWRLRRSDA
jgi:ABC-2 type transport system permease protein